MICRTFEERVDELIDGRLDDAESNRLRGHAADCTECAARMARASAFRALIDGRGGDAIERVASRRAAELARDGVAAPVAAPRGALVRRLAVAASLLAALAVGRALAPAGATGPSPGGEALRADGIASLLPRGAARSVAAGRSVVADEDALVAVAAGSSGERVRLDSGAAVFQVEHGLPFTVETVQGDATVLGTLFHVQVRSDRSVSVAVLSGVVRFDPRTPGAARRTLRAGTILDVDPEGRQRLVSRAQTNDIEVRLGMQGIELDAARGEIQRLEDELSAARAPAGAGQTAPPSRAPADVAEVPWGEIGVAARQLLRARDGDEDPEAMRALSVFLANAHQLRKITGSKSAHEWPLHPAVLSHAGPTFFETLAPASDPAARSALVDVVSAAANELSEALAGSPTPTGIASARLGFLRIVLFETQSRLGDAAAAEIASALLRAREGAPIRVIPLGANPVDDALREWVRWFGLDAGQAEQMRPIVARYLEGALAAQQSLRDRIGAAEADALLFPEMLDWRRRAPWTAPAPLADADVLALEHRRIDVKATIAAPRAAFERDVLAILRPEQATRGFVGWGLPTFRSHE